MQKQTVDKLDDRLFTWLDFQDGNYTGLGFSKNTTIGRCVKLGPLPNDQPYNSKPLATLPADVEQTEKAMVKLFRVLPDGHTVIKTYLQCIHNTQQNQAKAANMKFSLYRSTLINARCFLVGALGI